MSNEFSVLQSVLNDVASNLEYKQYLKVLEEENEAIKIFGKASYPVLPVDEYRTSYEIVKIESDKQYANLTSEGATEYSNLDSGKADKMVQGIVKIGCQQTFTAEDEARLRDMESVLKRNGAYKVEDLISALQTNKPSRLAQAVYSAENFIYFHGSKNLNTFIKNEKKKNTTLSYSSTSGDTTGVLDNHEIVANKNTPVAVNGKTKWSQKVAETGGKESIINDIVKLKNDLDDALSGQFISDSSKMLVLPKKVATFLKQTPYDTNNNAGVFLYDMILRRTGLLPSQVYECETLDLFDSAKGSGFIFVKNPDYFGCVGSEPNFLLDEQKADTITRRVNARCGGFKCAYPEAIKLITGIE